MIKKFNFFNADSFFGILVFIYVVTNSFFVEVNPIYAHSVGLVVVGTAFLFNIFYGKKPFYINNALLFYILFAGWSLLSFLWALDENLHIEYQQRTVFFVIMLFFIFNILRWHDIKEYFLWGFIISGFLNFLIFLNIITNPFIRKESDLRFVGTLGNSNYTAILVALSIFSAIFLLNTTFKNKNNIVKLFLFINIPACLYTIVQTGSRKGFVAGVALMFLFFIPYLKTTKNIVYGFVFALLFVFGFNYLMENEDFADQIGFVSGRFEGAQETIEGTGYEGSTEYRLILGEEAFRVWKDNPFIGVGMNNFRIFAGGYYSHNNYLETLANLGVIGFFLFYMIYIFSFFNLLKNKDFYKKSAGIFFIVLFLFMDAAWVSYTSIIYLMMLLFVSDIIAIDNPNKEKNVENSNTR